MLEVGSQKAGRGHESSRRRRRSDRPPAHLNVSEIHGYAILSKIGQGGMGAVFKARQANLDREVALKILPPSIAADATFIERFRGEARASAKLCHPNIVQGIDVGLDESSGLWYFAMEFIDGPTVKSLIEKRGAIDEAEALRIAGEVAQGLAAINHAGMVHRDIKPDNVLLTSTGAVKVADLGLSRDLMNAASDKTTAGQAVGTPHYMSPEQVRGSKDVDIRADFYGLGATLFHMVTGRQPFDGGSSVEIMSQHLSEPPPLAREFNPAVSAGCERLIVKLMAKKREDRVQTPEKLIADIDALLNSAVSIPEKEKHPSRHRTPAVHTSRAQISLSSRSSTRPASGSASHAATAWPKREWYFYGAVAAACAVMVLAFALSSPGIPVAAAPRDEAPPPSNFTPSAPKPTGNAMQTRAPLPDASPAGVWWEGENTTENDFCSHCWLAEQLNTSNLSGQKYLNHLNDANWLQYHHRKLADTLHASYSVEVPADGTYTLWVREYDPYAAAPWRFRWDERTWYPVASDHPFENKMEIGKDRALVWRKYPGQVLSKGSHTFRLEANLETQKIAAFDCFYLTTGNFKPNGTERAR